MVSIVILTRNSAKHISHCLNSTRLFVERGLAEVIVLDTGSKDSTVQMVRGHGITPHITKWRNDFAATRNEAIGLCNGDWIFTLDSDERIVGNVFKNLDDANDVYAIMVLSPHRKMNGMVTTHRVWLPRLFKNDGKIRYHYPIHETLNLEVLERPPLIGKQNRSYVVHLGYDVPIEEIRKKAIRNLDILNRVKAIYYGERNNKALIHILHHTMNSYYWLQEWDDVYPIAEHLIRLIDRERENNGVHLGYEKIKLECQAVLSYIYNNKEKKNV